MAVDGKRYEKSETPQFLEGRMQGSLRLRYSQLVLHCQCLKSQVLASPKIEQFSHHCVHLSLQTDQSHGFKTDPYGSLKIAYWRKLKPIAEAQFKAF